MLLSDQTGSDFDLHGLIRAGLAGRTDPTRVNPTDRIGFRIGLKACKHVLQMRRTIRNLFNNLATTPYTLFNKQFTKQIQRYVYLKIPAFDHSFKHIVAETVSGDSLFRVGVSKCFPLENARSEGEPVAGTAR